MNKKEKFINKMKDLYGLELPYDKSDFFNRHRNTIIQKFLNHMKHMH